MILENQPTLRFRCNWLLCKCSYWPGIVSGACIDYVLLIKVANGGGVHLQDLQKA